MRRPPCRGFLGTLCSSGVSCSSEMLAAQEAGFYGVTMREAFGEGASRVGLSDLSASSQVLKTGPLRVANV